jgi:hypothetical protein
MGHGVPMLKLRKLAELAAGTRRLGEQRAGRSAQATADRASALTALTRAATSVSTPSTLTAATLLRIKFGSCGGHLADL